MPPDVPGSECPTCRGDGRCWECRGAGWVGTVTSPLTCPTCRGWERCEDCDGTGERP